MIALVRFYGDHLRPAVVSVSPLALLGDLSAIGVDRAFVNRCLQFERLDLHEESRAAAGARPSDLESCIAYIRPAYKSRIESIAVLTQSPSSESSVSLLCKACMTDLGILVTYKRNCVYGVLKSVDKRDALITRGSRCAMIGRNIYVYK